MRVAKYFVLDSSVFQAYNEFKTQFDALDAAKEVRETGTYEPVIVKVLDESSIKTKTKEVTDVPVSA